MTGAKVYYKNEVPIEFSYSKNARIGKNLTI